MNRKIWLPVAFILILASPAFAAGPSATQVAAVKKSHEEKLRSFGVDPASLRVYSIGKSHIDAAFTWRKAETRNHKVPYTWRQALDHMKKYPGFTYHQSSALFYEWIKEDDPAMFREIQAREKEGRWIIVGGMWVEPDGNMPDGESYVRQFLYGQRFFIENFGHPAENVWLEDCFGFNWNLPQIAKKSQANTFYTLKLLWNMHTQFPFHVFWWEGPDGSRLLSHITPILSGINVALQSYFPYDEFQPGPADWFLNPLTTMTTFPWDYHYGYRNTRLLLKPGESLTANYRTTPAAVSAKLSEEIVPVVGNFYGAGDGGHGPLPLEINAQVALQQAGYARWGTTEELFKDFASYADRLPVWNDELYLEYHQGVFTTHEKVKRQNRQAEAQMRQVESMATFAHILGASYPSAAIAASWKLVLLNQFHDILPGSGIKEVYEDADVDYAQIEKTTNDLSTSAFASLISKIGNPPPRPGLKPFLIFNPLGWERSEELWRPITDGKDYRVVDADGRELPAQMQWHGDRDAKLYFHPGSLPALGWKTFYLEEGKPTITGGPTVAEVPEAFILENDFVRVRIERDTGWITSVFDKRLDRESLSGPSNKILVFRDQALGYPAWNIAENYLQNPLPVPPVSSIRVVEQGPVFVKVLIERNGETRFRQWVTIYRDSPKIELTTWTDLQWPDVLIKLEFNTVFDTPEVESEIPYGVIVRSTRPTVPWDAARTEMPFNKWLDFSDGAAGLALINEGAHGFSLTPDGKGFRVSIVKSSPYPEPEFDAKNVDRLLAWRLKKPDQTDQGEHWSYLTLMPHSGCWRDGKVYRAGHEYNTPILTVMPTVAGGPSSALPSALSLLSLDSPTAIITAIKKAEDDDGIIVRMVEYEGKAGKGTLKVNEMFTVVAAAETDLLELNPKPLAHGEHTVDLSFGHNEIKTVKLSLRKN